MTSGNPSSQNSPKHMHLQESSYAPAKMTYNLLATNVMRLRNPGNTGPRIAARARSLENCHRDRYGKQVRPIEQVSEVPPAAMTQERRNPTKDHRYDRPRSCQQGDRFPLKQQHPRRPLRLGQLPLPDPSPDGALADPELSGQLSGVDVLAARNSGSLGRHGFVPTFAVIGGSAHGMMARKNLDLAPAFARP